MHLAHGATERGYFLNQREAYDALTSELARLQMQHVMTTFAAYMMHSGRREPRRVDGPVDDD